MADITRVVREINTVAANGDNLINKLGTDETLVMVDGGSRSLREKFNDYAKTLDNVDRQIYVNGENNTILGENNIVLGNNNTVIGSNCIIMTDNSIVLGNNHKYYQSREIGYWSAANGPPVTSIGGEAAYPITDVIQIGDILWVNCNADYIWYDKNDDAHYSNVGGNFIVTITNIEVYGGTDYNLQITPINLTAPTLPLGSLGLRFDDVYITGLIHIAQNNKLVTPTGVIGI